MKESKEYKEGYKQGKRDSARKLMSILSGFNLIKLPILTPLITKINKELEQDAK